MAGAALVVFVVGLIVSWLWDPVFIVSSEATEAATCLPNTDGVHCIFGKDWNESGYLSIITNFYTTIITILIAVVGVISVFAFIVVRTNAAAQAREEAEQVVEEKVEAVLAGGPIRRDVDDQIEKMINRQLRLTQEGLDKLPEIVERLNRLDVFLEDLGYDVQEDWRIDINNDDREDQ